MAPLVTPPWHAARQAQPIASPKVPRLAPGSAPSIREQSLDSRTSFAGRMLVSRPIAELNKRLIETSSCPALPCPRVSCVLRRHCVPGGELFGVARAGHLPGVQVAGTKWTHAGGSDTASRGDPRRTCVCVFLLTALVRGFARQVLTKYTHLTRKGFMCV